MTDKSTKRRFNIFILREADTESGNEWVKAKEAYSTNQVLHEVEKLHKTGVTEIRVTKVVTKEVFNSMKERK